MQAVDQMPNDPSRPARRTQAERRKGTRDAVYLAATRCLIDDGLAGFKTARVAKMAGVSEGSVFRYFPTKAELLATTMERVFDELRGTYEERFAEIDGEQIDARALIDVIWELMGDERMLAVLELITRARTDVDLRDALKPVIARHRTTMHSQVRTLLRGHPVADWPMLGGAIDALVLSMEGMQLHHLIVRNPAHIDLMLEFITFTMDLAFKMFESIDDESSPLNTRPSR